MEMLVDSFSRRTQAAEAGVRRVRRRTGAGGGARCRRDDAPFSADITTNYLLKGNHLAIYYGMGTDAMNDAWW